MSRINSYHSCLFVDSYYIFMGSELRQDLVSGDWIVIAPKRAQRPNQFAKKRKRRIALIRGCPFENLSRHESILQYPSKKDWVIQIVKNKYPAFVHENNVCASKSHKGPYVIISGTGHHDVVITRDHYKNFAHLSRDEANLLFHSFRDRYLMIAKDRCSAYVSIFQNSGPEAGGHIYHPHFQMITLPIIPPDIEHSLSGSFGFWNKHRKCVHCVMLQWEKREKKRIVYENKGAIVFAPFVSREPFELRIFPKRHLPFFEDTPDKDLKLVVDALQVALQKIEKKLNDPDYNFFIHTAPLKNKNKYRHYHWHIEILPKISISAGFELGTGIEITVVDPDEAVKVLKGKS